MTATTTTVRVIFHISMFSTPTQTHIEMKSPIAPQPCSVTSRDSIHWLWDWADWPRQWFPVTPALHHTLREVLMPL